MPPVITLLTDFGHGDTYVGQVKGVLLGINPNARIVDLTHEVRPYAIRQGAFLLESAVSAFPAGTIHVAVVDPGVGGSRLGIAVTAGGSYFVGPDNGVLSAALPEATRPSGTAPLHVPLPADTHAVELKDTGRFGHAIAPTFHGRDVFAPAAAQLSLGVPLTDLGPGLTRMLAFPPFRALPDANGRIVAQVVSIDRFGNVITDVRAVDLPSSSVVVECRGHRLTGLVHTYEEGQGLVALIGSAGYLEIAQPRGNAAEQIGAAIGDAVLVRPG